MIWVAGIFFFLWGLVFHVAGSGERGLMWLFAMAFAWTPLALLIWFVVWRAGKRDKWHAQLMADHGVPPGAGLDHQERGDGVMLDPKGKRLVVYNGGDWRAYAYADVRQWEAVTETAGAVAPVGGLPNQLAGMGMAIGNARRAAKGTGLFITVRDVKNPRWRITMSRERDRDRWMEILRQELNEGGVDRAAA